MTEQNVTLNPGGGGSKVRTLEVTVQETDGSTQTVEMQVVSIADPATGRVLAIDDLASVEMQIRILKVLRRVAGALEQGMELGIHMAAESETDDYEEDET